MMQSGRITKAKSPRFHQHHAGIIIALAGIVICMLSVPAIFQAFQVGPNTRLATFQEVNGPDSIRCNAFNPNGPNMALVTPTNNSDISGLLSVVPVVIEDVVPGPDAIIEQVAQIFIDEQWYDMLDTSLGAFESFYYGWNLSNVPISTRDQVAWIRITNNKSISNDFNVNVVVDNWMPSINIISPTNASYITSDSVIGVQASDAQSGIRQVTVTITELFGNRTVQGPAAIYFNGSTGLYEYTWAVASNSWLPGPYAIDIEVVDCAGNVRDRSVNVTVDCTPPFMDLISMTNNSIVSGITNLQLRIRDPSTGINSVHIHVGAGPAIPMVQASGDIYEHSIDTTSMADQAIDISVEASNNATLVNQTVIHLIIDNTAPVSFLDGPFFISGISDFNIACNDWNGIGRVAWRVDNGLYRDISATIYQNITLSSLNYIDGNHTLYALIEDRAFSANINVTAYPFVVDNEKPEVSVSNVWYRQQIVGTFDIKIFLFDENDATLQYSVDQSPYYDLPKVEGEDYYAFHVTEEYNRTFSISFKGTDIAGNVDEDFYILTVTMITGGIDPVVSTFVSLPIGVAIGIVILTAWVNGKQGRERMAAKRPRDIDVSKGMYSVDDGKKVEKTEKAEPAKNKI